MVGAGISGMTCAIRLQKAGVAVTVFDKSRGPGGRITTRRRDVDRYDHGAQYFTVRSEGFQQQVNRWQSEGVVVPWTGRFADWVDGVFRSDEGESVRWVAQPRMSALGRHLAKDCSVQLQTRIASLEQTNGLWTLYAEDGRAFDGYQAVLLCCPGPQAADLLPPNSRLSAVSGSLGYAPSWVTMVRYAHPLDISYDAIRFQHPVLAWAARDSSKPGREPGERWVLQTQADWTASHLESSVEQAMEPILAAWHVLVDGHVEDASAHRWRYALSTGSMDLGAQFDASMGLGLCGDGLTAGRLEDAWRSGKALAELVLS